MIGYDAGGGNTDTIFTIRIDNGQTQITQIPRDSYINSARFGLLKANASTPMAAAMRSRRNSLD